MKLHVFKKLKEMKKVIIISCAVLLSTYMRSQPGVTIPLNQEPTFNLQSGTYIKDTEDALQPYVGIWEGIWSGKKITLSISAVSHHLIISPSKYHYEDILVEKYTITDVATNTIIASTMNNADINEAKIINSGTGKNNQMYFFYSDIDLCSISATILLKRDLANPNQMHYSFSHEEFWMTESCPFYNDPNGIPIPLPMESVMLSRILN